MPGPEESTKTWLGDPLKSSAADEEPLRFNLRSLFGFVTIVCVVLGAVAVAFPDLLKPPLILIVAFASYPVLTAVAAESIARRVGASRYSRRLGIALGLLGFVPAVWLNYPEPKIPMVAPIAGCVVILCFGATGALLGALIDLYLRPSQSNR